MTSERPEDEDDTAVQTRCPHCLGEQYALNVLYFSSGEAGCNLCGRKTRPMTKAEYIHALRTARRAQEAGG